MNNATDPDEDDEVSHPLTTLQIFFIKVATVTGAALLLMFAGYIFVASQVEEISALKGGHAFWEQVENKLYKIAEEPDLPEAKKAKIIAAIRKIADKYRPYVDAIVERPHK